MVLQDIIVTYGERIQSKYPSRRRLYIAFTHQGVKYVVENFLNMIETHVSDIQISDDNQFITTPMRSLMTLWLFDNKPYIISFVENGIVMYAETNKYKHFIALKESLDASYWVYRRKEGGKTVALQLNRNHLAHHIIVSVLNKNLKALKDAFEVMDKGFTGKINVKTIILNEALKQVA